MSCIANLNGAPTVLLEPSSTFPEVTSTMSTIPVGASCVTLTFRLCRNPAAVTNQVELTIEWIMHSGAETIITPESILKPTGTDCQHEVCPLTILSPEVTAPDDCVFWDLSFAVPAGKVGVQVTAVEVGDPANPGTLTVWVAYK